MSADEPACGQPASRAALAGVNHDQDVRALQHSESSAGLPVQEQVCADSTSLHVLPSKLLCTVTGPSLLQGFSEGSG